MGDNAANKQYRSVLHFNTAALPDTAVILSATLKLKQQSIAGTNPFTTHGNLLADIRKTFFGSTVVLTLNDFQATANKLAVATFGAAPVGGWYSATVGSAGYPYISRTGTTQFRLRFTLDDNNDHGADFVSFFSGSAPVANRPQLILQYYVP